MVCVVTIEVIDGPGAGKDLQLGHVRQEQGHHFFRAAFHGNHEGRGSIVALAQHVLRAAGAPAASQRGSEAWRAARRVSW